MAVEIRNLQQLMMISGILGPRIIQLAAARGLWDRLEGGPLDAEALGERLGWHPRGTEVVCNALVALGLLAKHEGRYLNTPYAARHLLRSRPEYDGHWLVLNERLLPDWLALERVLESGEPSVRFFDGEGDERRELLLAALHRRAAHDAPALWHAVDAALRLPPEGRMLDLGGGFGGFTDAWRARFPRWEARVFDLPAVCGAARRFRRDHGLAELSFEEGDFLAEPLPGGQRLILLSAIVHGYGSAQNVALLRRCREALAPGGAVVVRDFYLDETGTEPAAAALMSLTLLLSTREGRYHGRPAVQRWLQEAGFARIEELPASTMALLGVTRMEDGV